MKSFNSTHCRLSGKKLSLFCLSNIVCCPL